MRGGEVYWNLVAAHGFNADIYRDWTAGMKLQPCSPGFVDGRDAILLADQALTGGDNHCPLWRAFAKRGLGFSARQGSSKSTTDGTAAFDLPAACAPYESDRGEPRRRGGALLPEQTMRSSPACG